jgi:hypothetical protein
MKQKKISKKLTLNKSTVAVLNGNEGKKVKGGVGGMTTVQKPCDCDTETDCQNTNGPCSQWSFCDCTSQYLSECATGCRTDPYCC